MGDAASMLRSLEKIMNGYDGFRVMGLVLYRLMQCTLG